MIDLNDFFDILAGGGDPTSSASDVHLGQVTAVGHDVDHPDDVVEFHTAAGEVGEGQWINARTGEVVPESRVAR